MNKRLKCITLGCKVNQAESEALLSHAEQVGRSVSDDAANGPSWVVVNTCTVTAKASMQSRQAIRKAIRENPGATIIVTGCYAQLQPDAIRGIPGVDYIIGQSEKHRIFEIIDAGAPGLSETSVIVNPMVHERQPFLQMPAPAFGRRTRPFLKIQDGCDSLCTYCIVPYSRGSSRSLPQDQVLAELDELIRMGAKEIVLTGIHLGRWGMDLPGKPGLVSLLQSIVNRPGLERLRLSSLEPAEISTPLLDFIKESNRICRHFHVPMQSGDPEILKRMNRPYAPENYSETLQAIHDRLEDAAIGADIMVGFPGETAPAFENTYKLIDALPISYLHVFPFSPRPPAPAACYPDPVPGGIARQRARALADLGTLKKAAFYEKMKTRTLEVLVEKTIDRQAFLYKGLSSNYIPVYIDADGHIDTNRVVNCRMTGIDQNLCVSARVIDNAG